MLEFKVCTEINQAFLNFCGFQDSLIKPITRILVGVAVLTALIVLVMKETPEWAKKLNITGIDFSVPPWVLACVVILLYKKTVFALFLTVTILMVHVYFCTVDASIGVQVTSETGMVGTETQPSILNQIVQVIIAMFVMGTWQYFVHCYMHINKFLYRHIHSQHHRIVVPYAIGALYNHPLEGLLLDTVGRAISFLISGMTARTAVIFFCFATVKTVDDHCGLWLPGNLLPADSADSRCQKEEDVKNAVPLPSVVKGVLVQQLVQAVAVHLLFLIVNEVQE
ncbi:sphinganine C4-monooxygenase 1-like protein [Tanacetum coccineum]